MTSMIKNLLHLPIINPLIIIIIMFILILSSLPPTLSAPPASKPNCTDRCGSISIPFPFGTTQDCYRNYSFFVTCNQTVDPPKLFLQDTDIEITDISLAGQLTVLPYIARACYAPDGTRDGRDAWIRFADFTVNNTANKFTIVGCDAYAYISGRRLDNRTYTAGCSAFCTDDKEDVVEGSCTGLGCCQLADIPKDVQSVEIELKSFTNYTTRSGFDNCSYAFFAEETAFHFSRKSVAKLKNVVELPMVVDWQLGLIRHVRRPRRTPPTMLAKAQTLRATSSTMVLGTDVVAWRAIKEILILLMVVKMNVSSASAGMIVGTTMAALPVFARKGTMVMEKIAVVVILMRCNPCLVRDIMAFPSMVRVIAQVLDLIASGTVLFHR
ncbi:Wall-associated receptor kinase [Sesamum alatum]|uniref:Wall-associated receptor kinase n=1 Tax=Sesamum alatum TaxID=300844 RepID=A0AAE1XJZ6_9LAMI|nr:Wall-associated receptor kinase [Sesamum alatum]